MTTSTLIKKIKEENQDFEFYPTTTEIVNDLQKILNERYFEKYSSVLDIGCGNGCFFDKFCKDENFKKIEKFGIEKSTVLLNNLLDKDISIVGTDFYEQNLIDKKVDLIFSNPPYSEYVQWTKKIISEGNSKRIALVIPSRWQKNEEINEIIKKRNFDCQIIGTYNFENAERKARAEVNLLYLSPKENRTVKNYEYEEKIKDPFDFWFENTFKFQAEKAESYSSSYSFNEKIKKNLVNELILKGDSAEMLVELYQKDLNELYQNYKKLEELDSSLFQELNVNIGNLKDAIKLRLKGLKSVYWNMLFERYEPITNRFTSTTKNKILDKFKNNTQIDFTLGNITQLTLWLIKNSNKLFDEQIKNYFFSLCKSENIHRYKSNKRWDDETWQYIKNAAKRNYNSLYHEDKQLMKNIMLDYRIVVTDYSNFRASYYGYDRCNMESSCRDFLCDTLIIAKNLGFDIYLNVPSSYEEIYMSQWKNFDIENQAGEIFANVKLYKNGNRHIKFNQKFMKKLNVEMARINGWIKDKTDAMKQFDLSDMEVEEFWNSNLKITYNEKTKLIELPYNVA